MSIFQGGGALNGLSAFFFIYLPNPFLRTGHGDPNGVPSGSGYESVPSRSGRTSTAPLCALRSGRRSRSVRQGVLRVPLPSPSSRARPAVAAGGIGRAQPTTPRHASLPAEHSSPTQAHPSSRRNAGADLPASPPLSVRRGPRSQRRAAYSLRESPAAAPGILRTPGLGAPPADPCLTGSRSPTGRPTGAT